MSLEARRIWVDGELVPWQRATVHVLSQSIQRGSLVFDVMPCYRLAGAPAILGLREHVDRFLRSAALNGMRLPLGRDGVIGAVRETLNANPGSEMVKLSAYHEGIGLDVLPPDAQPTVAIAAFALADLLGPGAQAFGTQPARLQVAEPIKMPPSVFSPQIKIAAGYTAAAMAKRRARDARFHDVLFLDERGDVAESSTQSFFVVDQGILRTAPLDFVLAGITRRCVLELARDEGLECKEEPIPRVALGSAEEAFLTGTTVNIWPVVAVDAQEFPPPVPGPVTERLRARFDSMIAGEDPIFSPRWMQEV